MILPEIKKKYNVVNWATTTAGIDSLFSGECYDPYLEAQDTAVCHLRASFYCIDIYFSSGGVVVLDILVFNTEADLINYLRDKR
jgi:hypothetical protein